MVGRTTFRGGITKAQLEQILKEKDKSVAEKLDELKELIENNQLKLEAQISQAIEREMITQDSFDKIYNLLIEFGKKKGWIK